VIFYVTYVNYLRYVKVEITSKTNNTCDGRNFSKYRVREKFHRKVPLFLEIPKFPSIRS